MRRMSIPNPEIMHLIDAITRDNAVRLPGPPRGIAATADRPRRDRRTGVSGSAAIGFIIPIAILGTIAYTYSKPMPFRLATPRPTVHAAAAPLPVVPLPVAAAPVAAPMVAAHAPAPSRPRAPVVEPIEPTPAPTSGVDADGKAVHLTGAALEAALAEDRIKTRQLNLGELRDGR